MSLKYEPASEPLHIRRQARGSVWRQPQRGRRCMQARERCDLRQDEEEEEPPSRTGCGHVGVELNPSDVTPQHDFEIS